MKVTEICLQAGVSEQTCFQAGVSEQTCFRWKSKYGGMDASEIKRLNAL